MKIDYSNKKVLLIGGGGTIGTYIAKELLELGSSVDIICLEDYKSNNEKLRYIKTKVICFYINLGIKILKVRAIFCCLTV